jgi:Transposase DDE domain
MTTNHLYLTWGNELRHMFTDLHKPQLRNLTYLLVGIFLSRSVHLNQIASKIPGRAMLVSVTRRLSRFLDGTALVVRPSYESLIRPILARLAHAGTVHLIIDGSKVGLHHQLLMVSVAYRRRAIPVAWTWVRCKKGHSSPTVQIALLGYVRGLLPAGAMADLVGDCEFGAIDLITQVEAWGWTYALRQKSNHRVQIQPDADWFHCVTRVHRPGVSRWLTNALLTAKHRHPTHVLAHWATGEPEPWLLATNHLAPAAALKSYARRMWTEELFGDLKGHGFDLESSHLDHFLKLSRLTLAVVLVYVWLVAYGSQTIKRGLRPMVDRSDRRDLSIFQIGLRFVERCLTNALSVRISFLLVT